MADPALDTHNKAHVLTPGNATSLQVTLTGVAAGALIVAVVTTYGPVSHTASLSDGTAYTPAFSAVSFGSGYYEYLNVFFLPNAGSGSHTLTVSVPACCDEIDIIAASFTGVDTSASPMRGTPVTATGSSTTASSGAKTDFTVGDLVIGAFGFDQTAGSTLGSGSGWLPVDAQQYGQNQTYKIADSTSHTATCSGSPTGVWAGAILAFRPAEASTTLTQSAHRFVNDDGSESGATFAASENAGLTAPTGTKRVRIAVKASGDPAAITPQLDWRIKPSGGSFGAWRKAR